MKAGSVKRPLNRSILIGCILFVLGLSLTLGAINYFTYKELLFGQYEQYIRNILSYTARAIDVDDLETCMETGVESEKFKALQTFLDGVKQNIELDFLYVIVPLNASDHDNIKNVIAGVSLYEYEHEGDQLMRLNQLTGDSYSAATAKKYLDAYESGRLTFFEEIAEWGDEYTGLLPLYDSRGKKVAALCVDVSVLEIREQLNRQVGFIAGIIFILGALFTLLFNRWATVNITRPIGEVEKSVVRFANTSHQSGDPDALELKMPQIRTENEVASLAVAVEKMAEDMRQYAKGLVAAEQVQEQTNAMITAMASDYRCVYYVTLDTDEGICYRTNHTFENAVAPGEHFSFRASSLAYAENYVCEPYREGFLRFLEPDAIRASLAKELIISYRYLIRRDGRESYEMLRMAGVRRPEDRDDHIVHAIGLGFSDIDREMREAMAQSRALREALAAAEEANKAKTAFLSNMSHEIRTPMNAIIGLDNIALNDPETPEKTREYLVKIGASAQHLLTIINDILDMSRIESGRMTLRNEEFSFSRTLEQVNTIINGQCRDKGITYDCRVSGRLDDNYIGDDMKLRQIMINILGNAVKFTTPGGTVGLLIEEVARYDGKVALRFTFTDTGIGMSEEYLPKLFEPFSQEDSSSTSRYGSTGLGMPITKSLVELMNGNIQVRSRKGEGTTFIVTLTLTESEQPAGEAYDQELQPHEMSVLVIDDDPVACEHAKLVLGQLGIACESAHSGAEAIRMVEVRSARRAPYNLILVDWRMPEMDGLETTRRIRQIIGDDSAIIILTSYNWDDIEDDARAAGVDSFAPKPLFAGTVMGEFRSACKKRRGKSVRSRADLKGRRILLAEDVSVNAEIMAMVLQVREMDVDIAVNGRIAVEMFADQPPGTYDAILMDMRMPEMDGLEATMRIRAMDREDAKAIPIIALTANAFDEDVQRSLQAGLNAHLSKPVEPDRLYETLESFIK